MNLSILGIYFDVGCAIHRIGAEARWHMIDNDVPFHCVFSSSHQVEWQASERVRRWVPSIQASCLVSVL